MMTTTMQTVTVDVVVILNHSGHVLLDFNEQWGCFTLPMCKRQPKAPQTNEDTAHDEPTPPTILRAAVEVLGRPLLPTQFPQRLDIDVPPWNQSGRDGNWKRYQYHVFAMRIDFEPKPLPGHVAVWMTPEELETAEPISPTVRQILRAVPFADVLKKVGL